MSDINKNKKNYRLVRFAKHVLSELSFPCDVDKDINWDIMLKTFRFTHDNTIPGLMYLNWTVADHYGINAYNMRRGSMGRKHKQIFPKQIAFYIAVKVFKYIYTDVAEFYYYKTHVAVFSGVKKIEGYLETDEKLNRDVEDIIYKLKGYEYTEEST